MDFYRYRPGATPGSRPEPPAVGEDGPSSRMIKMEGVDQLDAFGMWWGGVKYFRRELNSNILSKRMTEEFSLRKPCGEKTIPGLRVDEAIFLCDHLQAIISIKRSSQFLI